MAVWYHLSEVSTVGAAPKKRRDMGKSTEIHFSGGFRCISVSTWHMFIYYISIPRLARRDCLCQLRAPLEALLFHTKAFLVRLSGCHEYRTACLSRGCSPRSPQAFGWHPAIREKNTNILYHLETKTGLPKLPRGLESRPVLNHPFGNGGARAPNIRFHFSFPNPRFISPRRRWW